MNYLHTKDPFSRNGRELQDLIGSTKDHTSWAKDQVDALTLKGELDYQVVTYSDTSNPNPKKTYWFTEEAAYKIAARAGHNLKNPEKAEMVKDNFALKAMTLEKVFADPDAGILFLTQLKEEKNKRLEAETKLIAQAPKVEAYNDFMDAAGNHTIQQVAALLNIPGVGRNKMFDILRRNSILQKNNIPYRRYIEYGYFECKEKTITIAEKEVVNIQTFVTPKGIDWIRKFLNQQMAA